MIRVLLSGLMVVAATFTAGAQEVLKTRLSMRKSDNTMLYTVSSTKEFYMGGNKHVLHIGDRNFDLYDQQNDDGKGSLSFFIPHDDFIQLSEGSLVYLTYGEVDTDGGPSLEEVCKQHMVPCWTLGKFSKKTSSR